MGLTNPTISGSYPLLLYGTFWYQLIPESNFKGDEHKPYSYLGSVIYLVALVPTVVFNLGLLRLLRRLTSFVKGFDRMKQDDSRSLGVYVALSMLAANAAVIIAAVAHYHVWSLMQGRYLFPSLAGVLAIFAVGAEMLDKTRYGSVILKSSMIVLMALFGLYFSSEIGFQLLYIADPRIKALVESFV